ncbi:MAG TPA: TOBE-like domain-containing protein, partial [Thermodesulfobacteriota bacterium]|nr:TOBE-like domain-containing protein [Thermodesulfobacteriota bacterium]
EALEVADHVVVMNEGKLEQIGTPEEVYDHPATPFVYNFLGSVNLFRGRLHHGRAHIGDVEFEAPEHAEAEHVHAVAYVRPHDFEISLTPNGGGAKAWFEATVDQLSAVGPVARIDLRRQDGEDPIQAEISREQFRNLNLSEGDRVFVRPRRLKFFAESQAQSRS